MTTVTIEGKFFHHGTGSLQEPWLHRKDGTEYEWKPSPEKFFEPDFNGVRRWTATVQVDTEDLYMNLGETTLEKILNLRAKLTLQRYLSYSPSCLLYIFLS